MGRRGCGKSTLLKLVSGLHLPSRGGVIVAGREVAGPSVSSAWRSRTPSCCRGARRCRTCCCRWRSSSRMRAAFPASAGNTNRRRANLLARCLASTAPWIIIPGSFSGGMQQRASLCRSLIHEPDLLLLDEPFGALDAFTREELWVVLQTLWERHKFTVVLVTHDLTRGGLSRRHRACVLEAAGADRREPEGRAAALARISTRRPSSSWCALKSDIVEVRAA